MFYIIDFNFLITNCLSFDVNPIMKIKNAADATETMDNNRKLTHTESLRKKRKQRNGTIEEHIAIKQGIPTACFTQSWMENCSILPFTRNNRAAIKITSTTTFTITTIYGGKSNANNTQEKTTFSKNIEDTII